MVNLKRMGKRVLPLFLFLSGTLSALTSQEFISWWKSYSQTAEIPPDLLAMEDYFIRSPMMEDSSVHWNSNNQKNITQIATYGYLDFKQTVALSYFTWVVKGKHPYAENLNNYPIALPKEELNRKHKYLLESDSVDYNTVTGKFLSFILQQDTNHYLDRLEEPLLGSPLYTVYQGRRVSQDLFNGLLEFISIDRSVDLKSMHTILEIGAGSGRSAYVFLKLLEGIKYIIADVPPALFVSQSYLSEVFPDKKIFKWREFSSFKEIEEEFSNADIVFLSTDQISKLKAHTVDLFLAIDCLHEMKLTSVKRYISEAERLSSYFYLKCWKATRVPPDGYLYVWGGYPIPANWTKVFDQPCVVPSDFFHSLYSIPN